MVDVIVIGGGHAGVEAALVCARLNKKTVLYTNTIDMIASMPCNPSIGGPAKGIVVREIDALGGEMGKCADATAIQFKMLNTTKGPGVQCLRVQSDKIAYQKYMQHRVCNQANLEVIEAGIESVVIEDNVAVGIKCKDQTIQRVKIVILTAGTFMDAKVLVGHTSTPSGPDNEPSEVLLSQSLRDNGIKTFRLKTGTPARIKKASIDFTKTHIQWGSDDSLTFSHTSKTKLSMDQQVPCYLTYTNEMTHEVIRNNLKKSAMYSGLVKGVGPRYCPSIEDKIVRFADKERHQIFLEPESLSLDTMYIQGFSTSLPHDVQDEMIHTLSGLNNCIVEKYGYAIEYDAIDPLQCFNTLESKIIKNLYTAGQVNGTSGYEEAAAQGLIAGINAVRKLNNEESFVLRRDEAYIGVMIDDLVTKGTKEPYRLLTSRAEYRLLLRHDNADSRLMQYGYDLNLISEDQYRIFMDKQRSIEEGITYLSEVKVAPFPKLVEYFRLENEQIKAGMSVLDLIKRGNYKLADIQKFIGCEFTQEVAHRIDIEIKYEGYIEKAKRDAHRLQQMESVKISESVIYDNIAHLSIEAKQKLALIRPATIGQASRISGVNPADIAVLAVYLKQINKEL